MDQIYAYYYAFLLLVLIVGIGVPLLSAQIHSESLTEHYMAVNHSRINQTHCVTTWLGGWDYDSFVGDIRVNGESVGHPQPNTRIFEGRCNESVLVEIYEKPVSTYLTLWNYSGVNS